MQATAILYFTRPNLYNFVAAPAWLALDKSEGAVKDKNVLSVF